MNGRTGRIMVSLKLFDDVLGDDLLAMYVDECIKRYQRGDWGEVYDGEKELNDVAVYYRNGGMDATYRRYSPEWFINIVTAPDQKSTIVQWLDERKRR